MLTSSTTFFRVVDYTRFKDGYLFRLVDNTQRANYHLAFAPFNLYPSVLMLDFLLADTERSAFLNTDLITLIRDEVLPGSINDFVILGDRLSVASSDIHKNTYEAYKSPCDADIANVLEGARVTNKKKLQTISNVSFSRDILQNLHTISPTDVAIRLSKHKLMVDKVGGVNREHLTDADIASMLLSDRLSVAKVHTNYSLNNFFRAYTSDADMSTLSESFRTYSSNAYAETVLSTAERHVKHNLYSNHTSTRALREIVKGSLFSEYAMLDYYVEVVPKYLDILRPQLLVDRNINKGILHTDNVPLTLTRSIKAGNVSVEQTTEFDRCLIKNALIDYSHLKGKLKAQQYPAKLHHLNHGYRCTDKGDLYLQVVNDVVRDTSNNTYINQGNTLLFEREICHALSHLRDFIQSKRDIYRGKSQQVAIECDLLLAYRDILGKLNLNSDRLSGSRFYLVESFKHIIQPQSIRKCDNVLQKDHNITQSSRYILQNTHISSTSCDISNTSCVNSNTLYDNVLALRDTSNHLSNNALSMFSRDTQTGMYLLKDLHQFQRSQLELFINSISTSSRSELKQLYLSVLTDSERTTNGKAFIEYMKTYDRVKCKLAHLRDIWLDRLVQGWELPETDILQAILLEDMLFGELLDSPAWISEYQILGDVNSSKIGIITANFIEGAKHKIQALINSGILLSTREGDVAGEIISINYDAVQVEREGATEYPDLVSEKITIPKQGWLNNLENPLGYLENRQGDLIKHIPQGATPSRTGIYHDEQYMGTRPTETHSILSTNSNLATVDNSRQGCTENIVTADRTVQNAIVQEHQSLGSKSDRLGEFNNSSTIAERSLSDAMHLNTSKIGDVPNKSGSFMNNTKIGSRHENEVLLSTKDVLATRDTPTGSVSNKVTLLGHTENKSAIKEDVSVQFERGNTYATLGNIPPMGATPLKQTDIVGTDTSTGRMTFAEVKERLANAVADYIFADTEEREADGLNSILATLKQDKSFELLNHLEAYRTKPLGSVLSVQQLGAIERTGLVAHNLMASPEKYGFLLKHTPIGSGILHDYNDNLLSQVSDVEQWSRGYGFGVPDDYDPLDPFNNYYPYTNDYSSHELTQTVSWTTTGDFEFIENTDIIKLNTRGSCIAVADVMGDNYKFSVDFCVKGNQDTAVDIVVKYINPDNYYIFRINGGDRMGALNMTDNMQLYKVTYGKYQPVGYPMSPHRWQKGVWHKVEVSLMENGSKLLIKVDDRVQYDMRGY